MFVGGIGSARSMQVAVGEAVFLLHPPLPFAGVSIGMERECRQSDSLADGYLQVISQAAASTIRLASGRNTVRAPAHEHEYTAFSLRSHCLRC